MRRLLGWLLVAGVLATVAGCYKGRGICDCLDYRDPCSYGPYSLYGPSMHPEAPVAPAPRAEPLKTMPKEVEPAKPMEQGSETEAPPASTEAPPLSLDK
jgi:hypothetical protein